MSYMRTMEVISAERRNDGREELEVVMCSPVGTVRARLVVDDPELMSGFEVGSMVSVAIRDEC